MGKEQEHPSYKSTRGYNGKTGDGVSFKDAVLLGLAPDGGLFVPSYFPQVPLALFKEWHNASVNNDLSFQALALQLMTFYVPESEIPYLDLKDIIDRSYNSKTFRHPQVTPLTFLQQGPIVLELFHGPTFAFKDVALQFLGNLFEYFINKDKLRMTVLGATSGDTGSSAIYGLRGKHSVEVFILFPEGKVSQVQELQMTTVVDSNINCIAIKGTFDDAQDIVKTLFKDEAFRTKTNLAAVNSINFARILAQIVYYFYAYFEVTKQQKLSFGSKISFSVPTGNFGDILAGFYAKQMGLPVDRLIVATNANNILHQFFQKGEYFKPESVLSTLAPSMDICVSSNFERFLYHMLDNNSDKLANLMKTFERSGKLDAKDYPGLLERCQKEMNSSCASDEDIKDTIKQYFVKTKEKYIFDPHSACGVAAAAKGFSKNSPVICLACAHWGKFAQAVEAALGEDTMRTLSLPPELDSLKTRAVRKQVVEAKCDVVKQLVLGKCT